MKNPLFILFGIILFSISWHVNAQLKNLHDSPMSLIAQNVDIYIAASHPTIDGIEDASWDEVTPIPINKNLIGETPTVTAYWKAMYDDENIYVLVNVIDDNHWPGWEASGNNWDFDKPEVFWDVNQELNDWLGAEIGSGHYLLADGFLGGLYGTTITTSPSGSNPGGTYAYALTGENYVYEMAVPWANFTDKDGTVMNVDMALTRPIGFDVSIVDQDEGITSPPSRKVWQNDVPGIGAWGNMDDCGIITLKNENLGDSTMATFRVDMQNETISPDGIHLNGSFCSWSEAVPMELGPSGAIYTTTLKLAKGDTITYKFINGGTTDYDDYELLSGSCSYGVDADRMLIVPRNNLTLGVMCFGSCISCDGDQSKTITVFDDYEAYVSINKGFGILKDSARITVNPYQSGLGAPYDSVLVSHVKTSNDIYGSDELWLDLGSGKINIPKNSKIKMTVYWPADSLSSYIDIKDFLGNSLDVNSYNDTLSIKDTWSNIYFDVLEDVTAGRYIALNFGSRGYTVQNADSGQIVIANIQSLYANAGSDQTVEEGTLVTLDGSLSKGSDSPPITYWWTTPLGIVLNDPTVEDPTFIASKVNVDTSYNFILVVNDGIVNSIADTVMVTVKNVDLPKHFQTAWAGNAVDSMNLNVVSVKLDGHDLSTGDEVGVFDGDLCVGVGTCVKKKGNIAWLGSNFKADILSCTELMKAGYNVFDKTNIMGNLTLEQIADLDTFDLVIMSRMSTSANYGFPAKYDMIQAPVLCMSNMVARDIRWRMCLPGFIADPIDIKDVLSVKELEHPIFNNILLSDSNTIDIVSPDVIIKPLPGLKSAGNGKLLGVTAKDSLVLIAEWDAKQPYYPGSIYTKHGKRMVYFNTYGSNLTTSPYSNLLTSNGCKLLLNIVEYMITGRVILNQVLPIVVSADDGSGNGYSPGNDIIYRFYDRSQDKEITTVTASYYDENPSWSTDGKFASGKTAFLELNSPSIKTNINVEKTKTPPTIDGIEETIWDSVDSVQIVKNMIGENPTVTAYWKAMYDFDNFYILVNVIDDNHWPAWESGGANHQYDKPEVFWDFNKDLLDSLGPIAGAGHYVFSPGFLEDSYDSTLTMSSSGYNPGGTYAYELTGENYVYEIAVPWSNFTDKDGTAINIATALTRPIGFDITVIDQDEGITTSRQRKVWQSDGTIDEAWNNMDDCGTITIVSKTINQPPVAIAGSDQIVEERELVTLNSRASFDPDDDPLTYLWTAPIGITLSSDTASQPTFTAPEVTADTSYSFILVVNDGIINSFADTIIITVKNVDQPTHFQKVWTGDALKPMNINVVSVKLDGQKLESGDEVAVFDGSLCVGVGVIGSNKGNIAWLGSNIKADSLSVIELVKAGYNVVDKTSIMGDLTEEQIADLDTFDLVIMSRLSSSGNYSFPEKYDMIQAPVLCMSNMVARDIRWRMCLPGFNDDPVDIEDVLSVKEFEHPIFNNILLSDSNTIDIVSPGVIIKPLPGLKSAGNGKLLGVTAKDSLVLIAEWDAKQPYYPGSIYTKHGKRMVYFNTYGSNLTIAPYTSLLSSNGCKLLLNIAEYMITGSVAKHEEVKTNVIFITENEQLDSLYVDLLVKNNCKVNVVTNLINVIPSDSALQVLEAADVILFSRNTNSANYMALEQYNSIATPIMIMNAYMTRTSRWQILETQFMADNDADTIKVLQPTHPIFDGVSIGTTNQLALTYPAKIGTCEIDTANNATVIASSAKSDNIVIAEWKKNTKFYDRTEYSAIGHRMAFFLTSTFDLTEDGKKMFVNAIKYLATFDYDSIVTMVAPTNFAFTKSNKAEYLITDPVNYMQFLPIVVSANDGSGNGYTPGHTISYRLYDKSQDKEITTVVALYSNENPTWSTDGKYASGKTAFVELNNRSTETNIFIKKTGTPLAIDGIEETIWDLVDSIPISKNYIGEAPTVTAYWKAIYDDDNFYVLVNVIDDNHWPAWEAGGYVWDYDRPRVYWDFNNELIDSIGPSSGSGHFELADGFLEGFYGSAITRPPGSSNPGGTYAYVKNGENYVYEMAVPWGNFTDKYGTVMNVDTALTRLIGFDVVITDMDEGITNFRQQKAWQNDAAIDEAWINMDDCGTITLVRDTINYPPVANAGIDQTVEEGTLVTLDGTTSSDPDDDPLTYLWTAPVGITLSSDTASQPTFITPDVVTDTSFYIILVVNDGIDDSPPDTVQINVTNKVIPINYPLENETLGSGDDVCYNAIQSITVAGGGNTVEFGSGSYVTLIAGQSIRFLPGFHALLNSYMDAYITTTGTFCDMVNESPIVEQPNEKSGLERPVPKEKSNLSGEKSVKVYPNPNDGRFTIELTNFESYSDICVYNLLGEKVYQSFAKSITNRLINLPEIRKGIYFVKVSSGKEQFMKKIIVK